VDNHVAGLRAKLTGAPAFFAQLAIQTTDGQQAI
jgi:hypothetical protein